MTPNSDAEGLFFWSCYGPNHPDPCEAHGHDEVLQFDFP